LKLIAVTHLSSGDSLDCVIVFLTVQ